MDWTRTLLATPRDGAVEALERIRRLGLKTGLITVCNEDVPLVWEQTPFAPLIDVPVFSCSVGVRKPDPQIYLVACERLEIEPSEAVFVGDGANDELAGAERVGMRAILVRRQGTDSTVSDFQGQSITRLSELEELLD